MNLPALRSWRCGQYTVRVAVRPDNSYWAQYQIYRTAKPDKLVGLSFSVPDKDWCESIERRQKLGYFIKPTVPKKISYYMRGKSAPAKLRHAGTGQFRPGRPTKEAAARRDAEALTIPNEEQ